MGGPLDCSRTMAPPMRRLPRSSSRQSGPATLAVTRLLAAARSARLNGAPEVARDLAARALAEPPGNDERATVLEELGTAELDLGAESGVAHLQEAFNKAQSDVKRAQVALRLARALHGPGGFSDGARVAETGLAQLSLEAEPGAVSHAGGSADTRCDLRPRHPSARAQSTGDRVGATRRIVRGTGSGSARASGDRRGGAGPRAGGRRPGTAGAGAARARNAIGTTHRGVRTLAAALGGSPRRVPRHLRIPRWRRRGGGARTCGWPGHRALGRKFCCVSGGPGSRAGRPVGGRAQRGSLSEPDADRLGHPRGDAA